jgi:transposase
MVAEAAEPLGEEPVRVWQVVDAVVGIDTHRDTHTAELAHPSGAPIATLEISNDDAGYAELIGWISQHARGARLVVSVEGTRSYGVGLSRALQAARLCVLECEPPEARTRRRTGKSDPIDAHRAVTSALNLRVDKLPVPRADGDREALRILLVAREEQTTTLTGQINRLRALLRSGEDTDRELARHSLPKTVLDALARRRLPVHATREQTVRHGEIRRLALAVRDGRRELTTNRAQLAEICDDLAPGLCAQPGIGPVSAAQAIIAFSHPGRCRHDSAFAKLAGTAPLEASTGETVRHRLSRGGDRKLNQAIHTIAMTRMRCDPTTRAYITRRRTQGKSIREIRRCLKRYITRQLYRHLTRTMPTTNTPTMIFPAT